MLMRMFKLSVYGNYYGFDNLDKYALSKVFKLDNFFKLKMLSIVREYSWK